MNNPPPGGEPSVDQSGLFPATQWTQVAGARDADSPSAMDAMDSLARAYWQPLYVLARQRGLSHEEAADAVQGFLSKLLTREGMRRIERRETRFRSFLGAAFRNWLSNKRRHENTDKRGGGAVMVTLDEFDSLRNHPVVDGETAEEAFDRRWARSVYDQAMARLRAEHESGDRAEYFAALRAVAFGGGSRGELDEIAERCGVSPQAVRKAASDLRARFGRMLRKEVERVVSSPAEVDAELRYLLELLTRA